MFLEKMMSKAEDNLRIPQIAPSGFIGVPPAASGGPFQFLDSLSVKYSLHVLYQFDKHLFLDFIAVKQELVKFCVCG